MASNPHMIYLNHVWILGHLKLKNPKSQELDIAMDNAQARMHRDIKPVTMPDQETENRLEDKINRVEIQGIEPGRDQEIGNIIN